MKDSLGRTERDIELQLRKSPVHHEDFTLETLIRFGWWLVKTHEGKTVKTFAKNVWIYDNLIHIIWNNLDGAYQYKFDDEIGKRFINTETTKSY